MRSAYARSNGEGSEGCAVYPSRSLGVVLDVFPISFAILYNVKHDQLIQNNREET